MEVTRWRLNMRTGQTRAYLVDSKTNIVKDSFRYDWLEDAQWVRYSFMSEKEAKSFYRRNKEFYKKKYNFKEG